MRNIMTRSPWNVGMMVFVAVAASCTAAARADESKIVKQIRWSEEKAAGRVTGGELVPPQPDEDPAEQLMVRRTADGPSILHVLTMDNPGVGPPVYMLKGQLRYEKVNGGYLELLNYFSDGGPYFTRTLSPSPGPMQALDGTSSWREFQLPFQLSKPDGSLGPPPKKLELNVALPKGGTVYLRDLKLVQMTDGAAIGAAWWSGRTAGMIGAIAGSLLGCLGALVGTLAGTGRARRAVICLLVAWIAASAVSLLVGTVALTLGQPYAVYYPLLILGLLGTVLPGGLLPTIRHRYRQRELRRMEALDVG